MTEMGNFLLCYYGDGGMGANSKEFFISFDKNEHTWNLHFCSSCLLLFVTFMCCVSATFSVYCVGFLAQSGKHRLL